MELHTCSSRSGNFGLVGMAAEGGHRFEKIYADGACSSNRNWIYLTRENGYGFITSFKVNTRPVSNGCLARGLAAGLWCKTPYKVWTEATGYHLRWKSGPGSAISRRSSRRP